MCAELSGDAVEGELRNPAEVRRPSRRENAGRGGASAGGERRRATAGGTRLPRGCRPLGSVLGLRVAEEVALAAGGGGDLRVRETGQLDRRAGRSSGAPAACGAAGGKGRVARPWRMRARGGRGEAGTGQEGLASPLVPCSPRPRRPPSGIALLRLVTGPQGGRDEPPEAPHGWAWRRSWCRRHQSRIGALCPSRRVVLIHKVRCGSRKVLQDVASGS